MASTWEWLADVGKNHKPYCPYGPLCMPAHNVSTNILSGLCLECTTTSDDFGIKLHPLSSVNMGPNDALQL